MFLHLSVPKCSFETNANTFKNVEIKPVSSHFLSREEFRRKLEIKSPIPIAQQSPIDSRVHVNDHPSRFRFVLSTFYLSHVIPLTDDLSSGNLNGSKNHQMYNLYSISFIAYDICCISSTLIGNSGKLGHYLNRKSDF